MAATLSYFPVDNGDMTLVTFESGKRLLIDCHIREKADDPDDDTPDVLTMLKERLNKDDKGRHFVDAFLLSHPDQDHCRGFEKHFYTGSPTDYPEDSEEILIKEIWSSPIVFRRASKDHTLCEDAKVFNTEAKRRVNRFKDSGGLVTDGDRILIMGEDEDGKTDDILSIVVKVDTDFSKINGVSDSSWLARLLAPMEAEEDDEEELLTKNHSSVVLRFKIAADGNKDACRFLTGGDAHVAVWERLWERNDADNLLYDILLTPHHCSWRSLSYDSASGSDDPQVNDDARSALSQTRTGAYLLASSKPIEDDDDDPPSHRAKEEYVTIADEASGEFLCVMKECDDADAAPVEFEIGEDGPGRKKKKTDGNGPTGQNAFKSATPPPKTEKKGGGRYA